MAIRLDTTPTAPDALVESWPTKEGVGQIVDAGDEHTQDGGGGKAQDQSGDGRLGHFMVLLLAEVVGGHGQNSFRCKLLFRHGKTALAMPKSGRNRIDS